MSAVVSAVTSTIRVDYEQPDASGAAGEAICSTRRAWARVPAEPSQAERALLKERSRHLLKKRNAVMVSHYYVHPDLQDIHRSADSRQQRHLQELRTVAVDGHEQLGRCGAGARHRCE